MPTVKRTRAEVLFDAIRNEVLSARIPPGTKLKLADFGERFDVSLALVREVMGRLAEQGLLQANPQRGFSMLPLSVDDLLELTHARVMIETATLRESIARGDLTWEAALVAAHHQLAGTEMYVGDTISPDFESAHRTFHAALLAGSGNSHLESIAQSLRDRTELYRYWSQFLGNGNTRDVACEHRRIAELTIARKADEASDALEQHIRRTTDVLVEYARGCEVGSASVAAHSST
ncbi:GntR family transcriptional regulator [Rhodococcus sp. NPDC004095]